MFTCGPQFFGSRGDHPAGDGLTRLQTAFAGASAADISGFGVSHVQSGGTLGNGYYDVVIATGGGFNPAWMQQLAYVDVATVIPTVGVLGTTHLLHREPTPLFDLLPPFWRSQMALVSR